MPYSGEKYAIADGAAASGPFPAARWNQRGPAR